MVQASKKILPHQHTNTTDFGIKHRVVFDHSEDDIIIFGNDDFHHDETFHHDEKRDTAENKTHESICIVLRKARLKANKELAQVSQALHISQTYLQAIEEANVTLLPERVYTLGFVRSYAHYVGLDPDEVVHRFKNEVLSPTAQASYSIPKPIQKNTLPSRLVVWVTIIIVFFALLGGWLYVNYMDYRPFTLPQKIFVPEPIQRELQENPVQPLQQELEQKETPAPTTSSIVEPVDSVTAPLHDKQQDQQPVTEKLQSTSLPLLPIETIEAMIAKSKALVSMISDRIYNIVSMIKER
jgi:cytoskeleton protein RodZ